MPRSRSPSRSPSASAPKDNGETQSPRRSLSRSRSTSRHRKSRRSSSPKRRYSRSRSRSRDNRKKSNSNASVNRTRLYVSNLPPSTSTEDLRQLFIVYGNISEAFVLKDANTGQSRCVGFVQYPTETEAQAAVEAMDTKDVFGHRLTVRYANNIEEGDRLQDRLYAANLSKTTTEKDIRTWFEKFGEVTEVNICKAKETGAILGSAFIQFKNAADAQAAQKALNGSSDHGSMSVHFARKKRERRDFDNRRDDRDRRGGGGYGNRDRHNGHGDMMRMFPGQSAMPFPFDPYAMAAYGAPPFPGFYPPMMGGAPGGRDDRGRGRDYNDGGRRGGDRNSMGGGNRDRKPAAAYPTPAGYPEQAYGGGFESYPPEYLAQWEAYYRSMGMQMPAGGMGMAPPTSSSRGRDSRPSGRR